jgi:hypothetical protein
LKIDKVEILQLMKYILILTNKKLYLVPPSMVSLPEVLDTKPWNTFAANSDDQIAVSSDKTLFVYAIDISTTKFKLTFSRPNTSESVQRLCKCSSRAC